MNTNSSPVEPKTAAPADRVWKMPQWLVIGTLSLTLAGGVYFAWAQLRPTPKPDLSAFEVPRPGNGGVRGNWVGGNRSGNRPPIPQPKADAITILTADNYLVRAGDAEAHINKGRDGKWNIRAEYQNDAFLPDDVRAVLQARALATRPQAAAATRPANLTPDQMAQLRKVAQPPGMVLAAADRDRLADLFTAYAAAADDARALHEKAFIDAFRDLATSSKDRTLALQTKRAEAVKSVLKPDQIEVLSKNVRRG